MKIRAFNKITGGILAIFVAFNAAAGALMLAELDVTFVSVSVRANSVMAEYTTLAVVPIKIITSLLKGPGFHPQHDQRRKSSSHEKKSRHNNCCTLYEQSRLTELGKKLVIAVTDAPGDSLRFAGESSGYSSIRLLYDRGGGCEILLLLLMLFVMLPRSGIEAPAAGAQMNLPHPIGVSPVGIFYF